MSDQLNRHDHGDAISVEDIRLKLAEVVRARALYWDASGELERMLVGAHGYVDKVDSRMEEMVDGLATTIDDPDSAAQVVSTEDAEVCIKYVEDFQ